MVSRAIVAQVVEAIFPPRTPLLWHDVDQLPITQRYWVVPGAQDTIRWILPHASWVGQSIRQSWKPYRSLAQWGWQALELSVRLGLLPLWPNLTALGMVSGNRWDHWGFEGNIQKIPVIYVGTTSSHQRAVVFLCCPQTGEAQYTVKVPLTPGAITRTIHEARILRQLGQLFPFSMSPQPLIVHPQSGISIERFESGQPTGETLTPQHIEWLLSLRLHEETVTLRTQVEIGGRIPELPGLAARLETLLDDDTPLPAVIVHGDFAPWNLKQTPSGDLIAVDWECARIPGVPLVDIIHFGWQQAVLLHNNPARISNFMNDPLIDRYLRALGLKPDWWYPKFLAYYACQRLQENSHAFSRRELAAWQEMLS